ncbi:MAG: hypothetical protein WCS01_13100, partial [bacterium]
MKTQWAIVLATFLAVSSRGEPVVSVDTKAIDSRARAEIGRRQPELELNALHMKTISWSKAFDGETDPVPMPPIFIRYDLVGSVSTNLVGT